MSGGEPPLSRACVGIDANTLCVHVLLRSERCGSVRLGQFRPGGMDAWNYFLLYKLSRLTLFTKLYF
jgi:hypothetical protein